MIFDRDETCATEPLAAELGQQCEQLGDRVGIGNAVRGCGGAFADLDTDVGPAEGAEAILVGHVVAEEDNRRRADLVADRLQRRAFVGLDDGHLDDVVAGPGEDVVAARWPADDLVTGGLRGIGLHTSEVKGRAGWLLFDPGPVLLAEDGHLRDEAPSTLVEFRPEFRCESEVEFAAVASDEADLLREPREQCQISKASA